MPRDCGACLVAVVHSASSRMPRRLRSCLVTFAHSTSGHLPARTRTILACLSSPGRPLRRCGSRLPRRAQVFNLVSPASVSHQTQSASWPPTQQVVAAERLERGDFRAQKHSNVVLLYRCGSSQPPAELCRSAVSLPAPSYSTVFLKLLNCDCVYYVCRSKNSTRDL
jgi:hypothetical protein